MLSLHGFASASAAEILDPAQLPDSYALGGSIPGVVWIQGFYDDHAGTAFHYYFSGFVIGTKRDVAGHTLQTYLALPTHGFSYANQSVASAGTGNYLTNIGVIFSNLTAVYIPANFNPGQPNMSPGNVSIFSSTTPVPDDWIHPLVSPGSVVEGGTVTSVGYGTPSTPNGVLPRSGSPMAFASKVSFTVPGNVQPENNFSGDMSPVYGIPLNGAGNNGDSGSIALVDSSNHWAIAGMLQAATGSSTDLIRSSSFSNFAAPDYRNQIAPYAGIIIEPPVLNYQVTGTNLVLSWNGPLWLQVATHVTGPFLTIPGATSPYSNAMTAPQQFFRLASTNAP